MTDNRPSELEQLLREHHERALNSGDYPLLETDHDGDGLTVREIPGSEYSKSVLRGRTERLLLELRMSRSD